MGLTCGVECVEASSGFVEALELFFQIVFDSDFFRFWSDFGRFWEANMDVNIEFFAVFSKISILQTSCSRPSEIAIFKVSGLQNP